MTGRWHEVSERSLRALADAMEADGERPPAPPVRVVTAGRPEHLDGPAHLDLEDGSGLRVEGALPPDLPLGYHRLTPDGGGSPVRLIVAPPRCQPPTRRTWGLSVQLPSLRSGGSWGIGDLADLRRLAAWSAGDLGAGLLLLNPLHADGPGLPQESSPYSPSSRRWRNPLYLRPEEVPGWRVGDPDLAGLAARGRAISGGTLVDRDAAWELKRAALERMWEAGQPGPEFEAWREAQGESLAGFATWCVLAERGAGSLPHPAGPEVARLREEAGGRVRFHCWLQWLLERQLAAAGAEVALVQDLAVGFASRGADAWQWQGAIAPAASIGAPPDAFNTEGQDWGLPPFVPWKLAQAGYQPFVETVRAGLVGAGGLRVDHVMGLFRLFWVPEGGDPAEGTYVRYPWSDLLAILALESVRAGAYVVGEDLGTVEPWVREELAGRGVLSYRLLWFEPEPPARWPAQAMGAVTTHDLPTVAGVWTGADLADQAAAGLCPNEEGAAELRDRLARAAGLAPDAPVEEATEAAHRLLGEAPSVLVCATIEDALGVERRPNLPGTTPLQRPNWSIPLPLTLEEIERDPRPRRLAALLDRPGTVAPC